MPKLKFFLSFIVFFISLFPFSFSYATKVIDKIPNNILIYHRFNDSRFPSTNTTIDQFESHIQYLISKNYKFITLTELINNPSYEKKTIAITVDDAYQSFYDYAYPILKKNNISATLFLSTSTVGSSEHLNWEQLKDLQSYGIDIQNHTHTHPHLPDLSIEKIEEEIIISQKIISDNLGFIPHLFAYPYGEASEDAILVMKKYFKAAFGQHSGAFSLNDPYYIARFPINENFGSIERIKNASSVLSFKNTGIEPSNQKLNVISNQKRYVVNFFEDPSNVTCYISDFNGSIKSQQNIMNTVILIELERPPVKGRLRFNCTKFEEGTYWYGYQYYVN
jgi:peptidoglycan/xylan/chitin deacetylase (PgdA/CDA1 family)